MNNCQYCNKVTDLPQLFLSMIYPIAETEELINRWGGHTKWFNNLERTDLSEEECKQLEEVSTYDQLLNTVGRGFICRECDKKASEAYNKYYPENEN